MLQGLAVALLLIDKQLAAETCKHTGTMIFVHHISS